MNGAFPVTPGAYLRSVWRAVDENLPGQVSQNSRLSLGSNICTLREVERFTDEWVPDLKTAPPVPSSPDPVDAIVHEVAGVCGIINAAHGRLVELIHKVVAEDLWSGHGIHSPEHWVAWRCGVSAGRARQLVAVARRLDELPEHRAMLDAGTITVDQAAVVARYVPADKDTEVAELTPTMTVSQLVRGLSKYEHSVDPAPEPSKRPAEEHRTVAYGTDDTGWGSGPARRPTKVRRSRRPWWLPGTSCSTARSHLKPAPRSSGSTPCC